MNPAVQWLLVAAEIVALVFVVPRLWRSARGGPVLRVDQRAATDASVAVQRRISVVIPARNEARRIGECLQVLRGAPGVLEVIVVDDESNDGTADIARSHGAVVVQGSALPTGWVGKIWALQQGISAATGDVIVTLDADTRPDPSLPSAATAALVECGAVLATVAPRFRCPSRPARWLHAAMLTSLVYRFGAGGGRATRYSVANGQCMVFRRDDAVNGGWCERVRGETVEDVALARALVGDGQHVAMFDGSRLLTVHMFDGFASTWSGWGRSLALTGVESRLRQWVGIAVTAVALVAPPLLVASGLATPLTLAFVALRIGTLIGTTRAYERRGVAYWLSPLADLLAWVVVVRAVVSPSRQWRGRQY